MTENTQDNFRCGFVSIIGRPNVGKSTLLNCILKQKVAIVSKVPQTTRQQIRGIYNDTRGQIIFIDTPGLHIPKDALGKRMNLLARDTAQQADCLIHVVDASEPTGPEEERVVSALKNITAPIILGLNKIDLKGKCVDQYIQLWEKTKNVSIGAITNLTLLPISAKTEFNIEKLLDILFENLPVGVALYPREMVSDVPVKLAIADLIREKLFWSMREEIPHSLAVVIEEMTVKKGKLTSISAAILVERESQKKIVIGKRGEVLKKVGTLARAEIEKLLSSRIFLTLTVREKKDWRENNSILDELGYGFESSV